jgi:hypothetical protein
MRRETRETRERGVQNDEVFSTNKNALNNFPPIQGFQLITAENAKMPSLDYREHTWTIHRASK